MNWNRRDMLKPGRPVPKLPTKLPAYATGNRYYAKGVPARDQAICWALCDQMRTGDVYAFSFEQGVWSTWDCEHDWAHTERNGHMTCQCPSTAAGPTDWARDELPEAPELSAAALAISIDCPVCGSRVYRGAERCGSCGSPRPGVAGWGAVMARPELPEAPELPDDEDEYGPDAPSWWVEEYAPFYGMTEPELHEAGRCAELVPIMTEDGPSDGRCLAPIADDELPCCEGHAAELRQWRAMPEPERAAWERRQDEAGR